ncbi:uncharacterized protein LOC141533431 [Cotesia typhae]|uniref:uncharacterized protein LOC141533431 n=1 Tax=Cotesia typhae TaxID=2053667 RepID=UPI003D697669
MEEIFDKKSKKKVLCQTMNCEDNITVLWKKLMEKSPSLLEQTVCSNPDCHAYTTFFPAMPVNHKIIMKKGFSALEKALEFYDVVYNIPCRLCKLGKQTRQNVLKQYLYIELDIRGCTTEKSGRKGKLRDFLVRICLNNQNDDGISCNLCFRLSGIAAYDTGHYLAYCRKLSGTWTKFNDLKSKPEFVSPGLELEPHGAFYVLEEKVII